MHFLLIFYIFALINIQTAVIMVTQTNGSELHRLKEFQHVDEHVFNKMYKICKPLINKLARSIDCRRYNVSPDIIQSYFWDKFMYVYNKYQDEYDEERLKATLISSIRTFKNKLLRNAYTKQAEFNQELTSFEQVFEAGREWEDDTEETEYKEDLSLRFNEYLRSKLTPDEYLIFRTELEPPQFIQDKRIESHGKISVLTLIDFFELPRTKKSATLISEMRRNIKRVLEEAKTEFKH